MLETLQIPLSERSDEIPERNTSESDTRAVFDAIWSVEIVGAHTQADKHLTCLERRKVVPHTDTLETAAYVLDEAGFLEGIQT